MLRLLLAMAPLSAAAVAAADSCLRAAISAALRSLSRALVACNWRFFVSTLVSASERAAAAICALDRWPAAAATLRAATLPLLRLGAFSLPPDTAVLLPFSVLVVSALMVCAACVVRCCCGLGGETGSGEGERSDTGEAGHSPSPNSLSPSLYTPNQVATSRPPYSALLLPLSAAVVSVAVVAVDALIDGWVLTPSEPSFSRPTAAVGDRLRAGEVAR